MATISEIVNKIRNAVYGKEVREYIAKGVETVYDKQDQAITIANSAKSKVDANDSRIDNIIAQSGTSDTEVVDMRTDINGRVYTVAKERVDAIEISITGFEGDIANINNSIENIENDVNIINTRNFLFIGDSWATSNSEFTAKSWVDYTIEKLGLIKGVNAFKSNLGGTGVATTIITPSFGAVDFNRLLELAQSFDSSLRNKDRITDIVICGGTNDYNKNIDDIISGMVTIKNTIKNQYRNVKNIYVGFIGCWVENYSNQHLISQAYNNYSEAAALIGATFLSDVFKAMKLYLTNRPVLPDRNIPGWNFHPNDYGSELISRYVSQRLLGGEYKHSVQNTLMNISLENEFSLFIPSGGNIPLYSYIEKDVVGVFVYSPFTLLNANTNNNFPLNGGKILIGSFSNSCLNPLVNRNTSIQVTLSITYAGERKTMPGALLFEEGKIYLITFTEPSIFTEPFYIEITQGYGTIDRFLC